MEEPLEFEDFKHKINNRGGYLLEMIDYLSKFDDLWDKCRGTFEGSATSVKDIIGDCAVAREEDTFYFAKRREVLIQKEIDKGNT